MGLIGNFGSIVFTVSSNLVRTFSELTQSSGSRWSQHNLISLPIISQWEGPNQDQITLKIVFSTGLNTIPEEEFARLREFSRNGDHFPLIIDGKPLSNSEWYIESVQNTASRFHPRTGTIQWMECNLTCKEYN